MEPVAADLLTETLEELACDLEISAVRIGMLGSAKAVWAVAEFLGKHKLPNVVLDPILKSSSGAELLEPAGASLLDREADPAGDGGDAKHR